jgi:hypothetical protein
MNEKINSSGGETIRKDAYDKYIFFCIERIIMNEKGQ